MHELSLSGAVLNTVVKHAGERRVSLISVRVGRLRQVVPDTLEFYFEFVARGTEARAGDRRGESALPRM
jgi:Zn finger protein HypA/HybF involved in hydrogenase expression